MRILTFTFAFLVTLACGSGLRVRSDRRHVEPSPKEERIEVPKKEDAPLDPALPAVIFPVNLESFRAMDFTETKVRLWENGEASEPYSAELKIRGKTSRNFPKKSYALKFAKDQVKDDGMVLGLPGARRWVLHGPWADKSLMRNRLAYALAEMTGEYAPRTRYVHLYHHKNGLRAYHGIYLLTESIRRGAHRLAIAKNKNAAVDDSYHGSFIFEIGDQEDDKYNLSTDLLRHVSINYPQKDSAPPEALRWAQSYFLKAEALLRSDDTDRLMKVAEWIDIPSFINSYIVQDIANDVDGFWKSQYLYKDRGEPLKMGPVWDFNFAFDNNIFKPMVADPGRRLNFSRASPRGGLASWFFHLFRIPEFRKRFVTRYVELRSGALSDPSIADFCTQQKRLLAEVHRANFERWGGSDRLMRPLPEPDPGAVFEREVHHLQTWLIRRMRFLDRVYGCREPGVDFYCAISIPDEGT